ncbi:MAG: NAD(P)H-hydrate dehydratase [Oscillospiraceae bacterium]|nr:NAD(P)H-hydrate dehydratase [Oscillospiraceae bacterium]
MFKACYSQEMRAVDRAAEALGAVPGIILMENAALACVNEIKKNFDSTKSSIAVFCGKGNNGGDGLAIARHLYNAGADITVFLVSGNEFKGDAKINFDIINNMDVPMEAVTDTEELSYIVRSFDIVVDAILGTGISGTVRGMAYDVIGIINDNAKYVLSVDVPSGINSDSGEICGVCINANKTVTFGAYKIGMFLYPGADFTGEIVVDAISIPQHVLNSQNLQINVTDSEFVRSIIKQRTNNSHKGDYGKLLIIAGSRGMSGAAYMSAQAALKTGAGLITIACCNSINDILETKTTEVMTIPLPDTAGHIAYPAISDILPQVEKSDAVLIGPGLGRSKDVEDIVCAVLKNSRVPVIVDADAIWAVAKNKSVLADCACEIVFTPHAMELSYLTGLDIAYIEENRIEVSKELSEEYGATVLLKGHHTIVTAPDLTQYINNTGNPGLASGGSGDVLAGIIAAFAAQGADSAAAAAAAAYIHGLAGDIASRRFGMESMTACDVLGCLPDAIGQITVE